MNLIRIILSIIGMIVIFSIVAEYLVMPAYTRQNQNRIMINIKNRNLDDALKILKSENYRYEVSDTLYTNKFQLGTIVDQYPKPNTRVKSGRTVRLKISQPEKSVGSVVFENATVAVDTLGPSPIETISGTKTFRVLHYSHGNYDQTVSNVTIAGVVGDRIGSIFSFNDDTITGLSSLTVDAQSALRRCIELFNDKCKYTQKTL